MPNEHSNLIGLSKYNRLIDWVMSRPQIQEEAVSQVAELLQQKIQPDGLAIVMEADHFCMHWRGVKDTEAKMINSVMRGSFLKDATLRRDPYSQRMADHAAFTASARQLMYSPSITKTFQFTAQESIQYGNTPLGNACLVARNAVRAKEGVSFVQIQHGGWDTHFRMFDRSYPGSMYQLGGQLDSALAALIEDLRASGDLDATLIVVMGEFGRTPGDLNLNGGRDHHRYAMSVLMAGGGVKGGRSIGTTDREGSDVADPGWSADRPIYPEDIASTIYSALGINWTRSIADTPSGRRFEYIPYADQAKFMPIEEVFG